MTPVITPGTDPTTNAGDERSTEDEALPFLRVVKGDPAPEELAALVTVLAFLGAPAAAPARRTAEWNAPRRLHRVIHRHGPGGWRASALPS
jgi:hypothetical protein